MPPAPFGCRSLGEGICSLPFIARYIFFCLAVLCTSISVCAQRPLGSWNIINAKLTFSNRWSVFTEGQVRSIRFFDDFFYYEIKGGVTYNINEHISLTTGIGRYNTYNTEKPGNFEQPLIQGETRTWVQLIMEQYLDKVHFEHRYRAEQRFTTNGYRNRFRYRLNVILPVNRRELIPKTLYVSLWDELFFNNHAPYFERNRVYAGLGYKFSSTIAIQAGYLRQYDYKLDSQTSRHFLQTSLLLSFRQNEASEPSIPSTTD